MDVCVGTDHNIIGSLYYGIIRTNCSFAMRRTDSIIICKYSYIECDKIRSLVSGYLSNPYMASNVAEEIPWDNIVCLCVYARTITTLWRQIIIIFEQSSVKIWIVNSKFRMLLIIIATKIRFYNIQYIYIVSALCRYYIS